MTGPAVHRRGFSLVEALVALAVLALVLVALLQVFAGGLRIAKAGAGMTRAVVLAQSKLAEMTLEGVAGEAGVGVEEGYEWRTTLEDYAETELGNNASLRPVVATVEVSWGDGPDRRSVTLRTRELVGRR